MQKHILQSEHNQKFHISICTHSPDFFFDWKITSLFYDAIHCLKALAALKSNFIGSTHTEIELSVSPRKGASIMPIPIDVWDCYHNLYRYSRTARYSGITTPAALEAIRKMDHNHCLKLLTQFKAFIKTNGVPLITPTSPFTAQQRLS